MAEVPVFRYWVTAVVMASEVGLPYIAIYFAVAALMLGEDELVNIAGTVPPVELLVVPVTLWLFELVLNETL